MHQAKFYAGLASIVMSTTVLAGCGTPRSSSEPPRAHTTAKVMSWRTYVNTPSVYPFSLTIPASWKESPPPEDRDGRSWTVHAGKNSIPKITAYGTYNDIPPALGPKTLSLGAFNLLSGTHFTILSRHYGSDWVEATGTMDVNKQTVEFYGKAFFEPTPNRNLHPPTYYIVSAMYPEAQARQYEELAYTVIQSFRPRA